MLSYIANFDTNSYERRDFGTIEQINTLLSGSPIKAGAVINVEDTPFLINGVEYMADANQANVFYLPYDFTLQEKKEDYKTGALVRNTPVDAIINENSITKAALLVNGLGSLGFAGGLFFAYKKQSHFWGYVGFGILGSIAGYAIGSISSSMFNFSKNK